LVFEISPKNLKVFRSELNFAISEKVGGERKRKKNWTNDRKVKIVAKGKETCGKNFFPLFVAVPLVASRASLT
jgi:hypothetical protein